MSIQLAQIASVAARKRKRDEKLSQFSLAPFLNVPDVILRDSSGDLAGSCEQLSLLAGKAIVRLRVSVPRDKFVILPVCQFWQTKEVKSILYATLEVQASSLHMDRSTFVRHSIDHFATSWHVDRFVRASVASAIVENRSLKLLQCIDLCSYDATPLFLRPLGKAHVHQDESSLQLAIHSNPLDAVLPLGACALSTNVLQTRTGFAWLLSVEVEGEEQFSIVTGRNIAHLQNLVSNKPEPMMTALKEQSSLSFGESSAESCSRLTSVDRHPSNLVVERRVIRRRRRLSTKWRSVITTCNQHKFGCVRLALSKPFDSTVTGIINVTRSIYSVSYLHRFQRIFRLHVFRRVRVVRASPSIATLRHTRTLLRWFVPPCAHAMTQRVLLSVAAQGDWLDQDHIDVFVAVDFAGDEEQLKEKIADAISSSLTHRRWSLYMRKKHGGAEEAVCDVALPLLCHGLLKSAYNEFVLVCSNTKSKPAEPGEASAPPALQDEPALPFDLGDPSALPVPFEFDRAAWAAQNDRFRAKAFSWLNAPGIRPLASAVVLRMCVSPVQYMEKQEFWVGSKGWEKRQNACAAQGDLSASRVFLQRDYHALVHARGEIEEKGICKMRMLLFDHRLWVVLPHCDWTNELKVMAFLGICGSEAVTEKLVGIPHRKAPYSLYLTLEQASLCEKVKRTSVCLLDSWSRGFLANNDIASKRGKMKLALHVAMILETTNNLEVTNAQLRRFVKKRTQTTALDLEQLSQKYIGLQFRTDLVSGESPGQSAGGGDPCPSGSAASSSPGVDASTSSSGGGGSWRAYVRKQRSNKMSDIAVLYRALKEAGDSPEWHDCVEQGRIATDTHKSSVVVHGETSFGPSRRSVASNACRDNAIALLADHDHSRGMAAFRAVDSALPFHGSVEGVLKQASAIQRASSVVARHETRAIDNALAKFQSDHSASWRSEVSKHVRGFVNVDQSFVATPGPVGGVKCLSYDPHSSGDLSSDLCSHIHQHGLHKYPLQAAMRSHWSSLHRPIDTEEPDVSSDSDDDNAHGSCWLLGTCVCGDEGQRVFAVRNRLLRVVKTMCPYSQDLWKRAALGAGRIILRFVSSLLEGAGDVNADELAEFWGLMDDERFWHVSHMSFSPYEPMLQSAQIATDGEAMGAACGAGEIALKVSWDL